MFTSPHLHYVDILPSIKTLPSVCQNESCNKYVCRCTGTECVCYFDHCRAAVFLHASPACSSWQLWSWQRFWCLCSWTHQRFGSLCVAKALNSSWLRYQKATGLIINFSPRLMSPISFFFGPFPKLLLRDHEKNMPRFLSALSSRLSSLSDLPDLCFLASCWLKNKNKDSTCYAKLMRNVNDVLLQWKAPLVRSKSNSGTFFGVESVERSELALCFEGAGLQGIW